MSETKLKEHPADVKTSKKTGVLKALDEVVERQRKEQDYGLTYKEFKDHLEDYTSKA